MVFIWRNNSESGKTHEDDIFRLFYSLFLSVLSCALTFSRLESDILVTQSLKCIKTLYRAVSVYSMLNYRPEEVVKKMLS